MDPSALWHTFIGSFFELLELRRTLDEVEDLAGEEARRSQDQAGMDKTWRNAPSW